jgi:hypothetical protein
MLVINNHIVLQEISTNNLSVYKETTLVKTLNGVPDEHCSSPS